MQTESFFSLSRACLLALGALLIAPSSSQAQPETLRVVMQTGLRLMDPIMTTAYISRDHGYMIYDTLLGLDSHFEVRPQMADWTVSEDGLVYTFTLRDGLQWNDGAPVTSEDCIASIRRWAEVDGTGGALMTLVKEIKPLDERSFEIALSQPTELVLEGLSKLGARPLFIMPKRVAETPASQGITDYTGSGPYRFLQDEFQPGIRAVYEKNPDYIPRDEPADWTAGGKVVNVERVEWVTMPDQMTAVNALANGEVDYIQQLPFDLIPLLDANPDVTVKVLDTLGSWTFFSLNPRQRPFNNKLLRQAALAAVSQQDILDAMVGNPAYYQPCAAIMGCGTVNGDETGKEWIVDSDKDRARALMEEGGYNDEPVVILQPTDVALFSTQPIVIGEALREVGFNVQMKTMDWQSAISNLTNDKSPAEGGWNIFITGASMAIAKDPFGNSMLATDGLAVTRPDIPAMLDLRMQYAKAPDAAARGQIAVEIQKMAMDEVAAGPLGQFQVPAAFSNEWTGFMEAPVTVFWNVSRAAD
ncbi:ABC transporter substrate-binding protein [Mesorhizobium sp. CAU 1741]|uniref:ABC transporter substrate-binding protein n=1 Tax=Mesorhizobium sp. CAU 1741 TaxID=3140366 RepID=UPI00325B2677